VLGHVVSVESVVRDVGDGFGEGAEGRRRVCPPHGAGEWHGHELGLPVVGRHDECELGGVARSESESVESVGDVYLEKVHGPKGRVRVVYAIE
jgi:hypothetical protein